MPALATTYFVDKDGDNSDGLSWATAFTDLQSALAAATSGDEIRIEATVFPGPTGGCTNEFVPHASDRSVSFVIPSGVTVIGGWHGYPFTLDCADGNCNDGVNSYSVLSGDLSCDDEAGNYSTFSDNSYHVVVTSGNSNGTYLQQIVVRGGYASGTGSDANGGGIYSVSGSPRLIKCQVWTSYATGNGGGAYFSGGTPYLGEFEVYDCGATGASSKGGGVFMSSVGSVIWNGGRAAACFTDEDAYTPNCGRSSSSIGGALYSESSAIKVRDVEFFKNSSGRGGAVYLASGSAHFSGACQFGNDMACDAGGAFYVDASASLTVCGGACEPTFFQTKSPSGGAIRAVGTTHVVNSSFSTSGCGVDQGIGTECYDGLDVTTDAYPSTVERGGAVYFTGGTGKELRLTGCAFQDCHATIGGAILAEPTASGVDVVITNCTFTQNSAYDSTGTSGLGGAIRADSNCDLEVYNSILWDDEPAEVSAAGSVTVQYSDVEGGFTGTGNINSDPGLTGIELGSGSPCIDAGDTSRLPSDGCDFDGDCNTGEQLPADIAGYVRVVDDPSTTNTGNGVIDMGAREFGNEYLTTGPCILGDLNGDGAVGLADLAILQSNYGTAEGAIYCEGDLDGDGDVDLSDYTELLSHFGLSC